MEIHVSIKKFPHFSCLREFTKEIENISLRVPTRYRNTRGSLGELKIAWKHTWKFGRTQNCVETYLEVWENSKLCGNIRGSLGEFKIAWKHSWKFERIQNCVQTLVEVWENSKLRANTRGSLGELKIACKHSWKFGRTQNCVETYWIATSISRSLKLLLVFV